VVGVCGRVGEGGRMMFIAIACSVATFGVLMWLADHNIIGGILEVVFSKLSLSILLIVLWFGVVLLLS
jgi:hypothetical protein